MGRKQEGIVIEVQGEFARVKTSRHNDCENCGACPGNSAIVLQTRNLVQAKAGQLVEVEVPETGMLRAAFVVFVLPLLMALAGAEAGKWIAGYWDYPVVPLQVAGAVIAFLLAVVYVKYYDYRSRAKQEMHPFITKILEH